MGLRLGLHLGLGRVLFYGLSLQYVELWIVNIPNVRVENMLDCTWTVP